MKCLGAVCKSVGLDKPGPEAENTPKNRILTLLHGDLKLILQSMLEILLCSSCLLRVNWLILVCSAADVD